MQCGASLDGLHGPPRADKIVDKFADRFKAGKIESFRLWCFKLPADITRRESALRDQLETLNLKPADEQKSQKSACEAQLSGSRSGRQFSAEYCDNVNLILPSLC